MSPVDQTELTKRPVMEIIQGSVAEFAKRLPPNIEATRWVMQLATCVQKNPELLECEPRSLLLAAYEAAELGISLSPTLQLGYLIPYRNKETQKLEAQFQISWRGLVQKIYESGCVQAFYAEVVYQSDKFERQYAPKRNLFHAPADCDRGEAIGAYALVEFKNGTVDWEYCPKALIDRHRKHSKRPDGLMWSHFWEEAWKKTAIRLLAKRLPLSNPTMEALAEVIERDAKADLEPEPAGKIEFDDPSLFPQRKPIQIDSKRDSEGNAQVFYRVGKDVTTVSGKTTYLKDVLPKFGGKWDSAARVWRMPATNTHELVAVCEQKQIRAVEVDADESETTELATLWPRDDVSKPPAL